MLIDVLGSTPGVYLLTCATAVGVGLILGERSRAATAAAMLLVFVFASVAVTLIPHAVWAGPVFALVALLTALLRDVHRYADNPLLEGSSYPHRVLLVLAHSRKLRATEDVTQTAG